MNTCIIHSEFIGNMLPFQWHVVANGAGIVIIDHCQFSNTHSEFVDNVVALSSLFIIYGDLITISNRLTEWRHTYVNCTS